MISSTLPSFSFVCLMCFFSYPPFSLLFLWSLESFSWKKQRRRRRRDRNKTDTFSSSMYTVWSFIPLLLHSFSRTFFSSWMKFQVLLFLILSRVLHLMPILFLSIETQTSLFPLLQSTDGRQDDRPTNDYLLSCCCCLASPDVVLEWDYSWDFVDFAA